MTKITVCYLRSIFCIGNSVTPLESYLDIFKYLRVEWFFTEQIANFSKANFIKSPFMKFQWISYCSIVKYKVEKASIYSIEQCDDLLKEKTLKSSFKFRVKTTLRAPILPSSSLKSVWYLVYKANQILSWTAFEVAKLCA